MTKKNTPKLTNMKSASTVAEEENTPARTASGVRYRIPKMATTKEMTPQTPF